jgi:hypothetical protein
MVENLGRDARVIEPFKLRRNLLGGEVSLVGVLVASVRGVVSLVGVLVASVRGVVSLVGVLVASLCGVVSTVADLVASICGLIALARSAVLYRARWLVSTAASLV